MEQRDIRRRFWNYWNPAPYEPGAFYRRELPCLLGVLERGPDPDIVVVDGYVELVDGEPGLGVHLHKAIARPVIGVAKTRFSGAAAVEVRRGDSRKPLYVTAAGLSAEDAASQIIEMHGLFRNPHAPEARGFLGTFVSALFRVIRSELSHSVQHRTSKARCRCVGRGDRSGFAQRSILHNGEPGCTSNTKWNGL